ncbi:hypothetical protein GCM10022215_29850 [Nocardioides fonticola]|uniref:Terminase n=1 Tax=Nocardioides fonticola TaxID=450363 RepID=A0ABP7XRR6_9ACTN
MAAPTHPKAPTGLRPAGRKLWNDVVAKYTLRVDELAVLARAAKTADRLAELEKAHADLGRPFLTRGSMGQDVIHPLIAEIRNHEAHLSTQLAKLKLPDMPAAGETGGTGRRNQQRDAAQSRWAQAHGAGA